jgi:hypothetical protein
MALALATGPFIHSCALSPMASSSKRYCSTLSLAYIFFFFPFILKSRWLEKINCLYLYSVIGSIRIIFLWILVKFKINICPGDFFFFFDILDLNWFICILTLYLISNCRWPNAVFMKINMMLVLDQPHDGIG